MMPLGEQLIPNRHLPDFIDWPEIYAFAQREAVNQVWIAVAGQINERVFERILRTLDKK